MIQDARGWCTGMTQRDGIGREEGVGFRMENTCTPMADSCQCMAKPLQYCKVISLQLKLNKFIFKKFNCEKNKKIMYFIDIKNSILYINLIIGFIFIKSLNNFIVTNLTLSVLS